MESNRTKREQKLKFQSEFDIDLTSVNTMIDAELDKATTIAKMRIALKIIFKKFAKILFFIVFKK